ncbi:hypothetical protein SMICM304S_08252 [Streptomyces microflavus]
MGTGGLVAGIGGAVVAVPLVAVTNTVVGYLRSYGAPRAVGGQHGATALGVAPTPASAARQTVPDEPGAEPATPVAPGAAGRAGPVGGRAAGEVGARRTETKKSPGDGRSSSGLLPYQGWCG